MFKVELEVGRHLSRINGKRRTPVSYM